MDGLEVELDALERILCGQNEPNQLDFKLLKRLTGDFSDDRRIGDGGCGVVYKGILPSGVVIAVKKLRKDTQNVTDENMFLREAGSMLKADHPNVVRLLGYSYEVKKEVVQVNGKNVMAEDQERLLCFQYISQGSLDKHLTDELRGFGWDTRYRIIKGICDGLVYLHRHKGILHMDLKSANILLGDQMVPKITDFGLSRIDGKTQITMGPLKYSPGYCAPEYIDGGKMSWKSDIYSLGVIMTELITGSREMPNTTKVLRRWRHRWNKSSKHTPLWYLQVKTCLELAVRCQRKDPLNRPFIREVVHELNKLDSWDGQIRESSLDKIISSSDDMLGIEPLELSFTLGDDKKQICSIQLTNDTNYYMAFRIATTSGLPFSIQPDMGIAAPQSKCAVSITLSATPLRNNLYDCGEEFFVQSTRIDGSLRAVDITIGMFDEEGGDNSQKKIDGGHEVVDKVKLTVRFAMLHEEHQNDVANLSAAMGSLGTSSSQEVQQSVERSPYHDYAGPREMEVLERILDGSKSPSRLPLSLLQYITGNFSDERRIGSGAIGEVYKGILGNKIVAVKKFTDKRTIDDSMFRQEITTMMKVEHKNIVRFLGYCSDTEEEALPYQGKLIMVEKRERLLCFEYITNGNLGKYITDELRGLEWHTRYEILLGICEGLHHLHVENQIVHMHLKPSNVLLSHHMVPKIADLALSRHKDKTRDMNSERLISAGYSATEYIREGRTSAKSDIYSLGVVIIDLVTGSTEQPNINSVLRRWMHRWNKSAECIDVLLWRQQVTKCLELASTCLQFDPTQRPHIREIIDKLESVRLNSCLDDMLGVEPLELHFPVELNKQQSRTTCLQEDPTQRPHIQEIIHNGRRVFCFDDMLGIEPLDLHFPIELNRQLSRSIQLTNNTDHSIAFMIRTKSELAYSVQPDKEVVPPRFTYSVTITLQAQGKEPGTLKDKITVLSTRVNAGVTAADISKDMFNEKDEYKVVDKVSVMVNLAMQ